MRRFRIVTPEQVAFHYVLAGPFARCMAWAVDQLIIWAAYAVIVIVFGKLGGSVGLALIVLGFFVVDFSYFTVSELYSAGQSPGKRAMKVRVISARGGKLAAADVMIRCTLRVVDALPFGMVVGGITCLIDRRHRRLGDLVADTVVVRDVRQTAPATLATEKARVNSFQADAAVRNRILNGVNRAERDLILDLVLRRDQVDPAVRERLFGDAAAHFRARLALPPDLDHLSDEQAVVNLALVIQNAKFTV